MYIFFLALAFFCSCHRLEVDRRFVDQASLASTYVKSPDPLQKHPPKGEELWVYWDIPVALMKERLSLTLKVVFKNLEEDLIAYPVRKKRGHYVYSLMDSDYHKKGGILGYKAEVTNEEGEIVAIFKNQMWFKPIVLL